MLHFEKEVPLKGEYEIIVAGGGVAGVAAAVTAARAGKRVLLIEKSVKLGGLATLGLVNFFVPMCNGRGKQIIFGMAEELLRRSIAYGYNSLPKEFENGRIPPEILKQYAEKGKLPPRYMTRFSAEIFALVLTELCQNEGVELLFDTVVTHTVATADDAKILRGLVVENKSGIGYYRAKEFIDATGDGDVMAKMQLPTVTRGNYHTYYGFQVTLESCKQAVEQQNIDYAVAPCYGGNANLYGGAHPQEIPLYNGTKAEEVNRYLISNQLQMLERLKAQNRLERDVVTLPGMPQFRTTRRIDGDYTLTEQDAFCHFEDSIGAICDFDRRDYLFEIPYRTMVKSGYDNIITAGRTVAGEGYAWDVLRVIPPAIITGQAAGQAAAQALNERCAVAKVNMPALQAALAQQRVQIHFNNADVPEKVENIHENNDN